MQYQTLDSIIKSLLLKKGYPIHYYMQFLVSARDALREISLDDLKVVNTVLLTLNSYYAVDLPCDFVSETKVGARAGQFVRPMSSTDKINSLPYYNSQGQIAPYPQDTQGDLSDAIENSSWFGFSSLFWRLTTSNEYGENIGRLFGWGAGVENDIYKVIPERGIIQFVQNINCSQIVLEYISNGMSCDAATQVSPYAWATIEAYINWQHKENNRTYGIGERQMAEQEYIKQRKILRAREGAMTIFDLKRIVQRTSYASPKYS